VIVIGWKRARVVPLLLAALLSAGASPPRPASSAPAGRDGEGRSYFICALAPVLLCGLGWPSCPLVPGGCYPLGILAWRP